jgi:hypothetical protein
MKNLKKILLLLGLTILASFSCNEENETDCYSGKIIEITCGGTVVQFLTDGTIGEEWINNFSFPALEYTNCVLVGNLSEENHEEGDVIYFDYKEVEVFTSGDFCDIGGLPNIKIEILELYSNNCID